MALKRYAVFSNWTAEVRDDGEWVAYAEAQSVIDALRDDIKRLKAIIADDGIAGKVAGDCPDPDHDPRWCPTCDSRRDGIDAYRDELKRRIDAKEAV